MIENFDHLVKKIGHITNGNRVYYNRRSQPPLFPHMVQVKYVTKMIKYKNDQNCWFINGFWFRITWHPMTTSSTSESCWMRWSIHCKHLSKADHYITIVVMITTLIIIATIAIITGYPDAKVILSLDTEYQWWEERMTEVEVSGNKHKLARWSSWSSKLYDYLIISMITVIVKEINLYQRCHQVQSGCWRSTPRWGWDLKTRGRRNTFGVFYLLIGNT